MASIVKPFSFFFLVVLFSSLQIEASDRLYFSKVGHSNNNYNAEDPKLPLSYEQEPKLTRKVASLPTLAQKLAPPPPKQPRFTRNQYGEYGLVGSLEDRSPTVDTRSTYENQKKNSNNNGDEFIYKMETDDNSNNIWDELKQQGLSDTKTSQAVKDTMSLENGQYTFGIENQNKNSFSGYKKPAEAWRGSTQKNEEAESGKQNEFESLEEYEKYLKRMGYLP